MNRLRHIIFPLALALILGGLSAWLERISEVSVENNQLDPNKPQYSANVLTGKRFDEQGALKETLVAQSAWQLPNQQHVVFKDIQLNTFENGQSQYQVIAHDADYNLDNKVVIFQNDVILKQLEQPAKPNKKAKQELEIKTDFLTVDTQAQTAQTQSAVQFKQGQSNGSANGLFYDHKNQKLDLPNKVKALIFPTELK